jgi:saccharopine dehydrogenase-like NADP-dependent oxidoreductase
MAAPKTKRTNVSVDDLLNSIKDDQVREDCWAVIDIMQKATNAKPQMWGSAIVGFGTYEYKYASGREGTWPLTAFSPRKKNITLYIMPGFQGHEELMAALRDLHLRQVLCVYQTPLGHSHANAEKAYYGICQTRSQNEWCTCIAIGY